jgi:3-dehydroquinate synthase class II
MNITTDKCRTLLHATAASALLSALPMSALHAQQAQQAQPPAQQQQQAPISDEALEQFSKAASTVREVRQEYSAEIQSTKDEEKAQALREEAQQKMVVAVQDAGLSVPEYNLIAQRLQSDGELMQRLNQIQSQ